jgi:hypothetical protein
MRCRFTNREIVRAERLFGPSSGIAGVAATPSAIAKRRAHGILMTTNFMLVMPLGALAARQLRCHWLKNPAVRASLFYVHIATQVWVTQGLEASFDDAYCRQLMV